MSASSGSLSVRTVYLSHVSHRCDRCEALMIQRRFCHETGCPNTNSRYDAEDDRWIKQRKCFECGQTVDADSGCCNVDENFDVTEEMAGWART